MSIVLHIGAVRTSSFGVDHLNSGQDATNSDSDALDLPSSEETYHRPSQTYPGCFGLPYQDHNYGAPPPLSPTPPKSPPVSTPKINVVAELEEEAKVPVVCNEEVVEDSITRCICGFLHDDGYMICCDKCSVWQHIDCMGVDRNNIPESYCCELCEPRTLDAERAKMIQLRKREEIDTSATDTDPEEPANALASLGKKPIQAKPKAAKQRRITKSSSREKGMLKTSKLSKSNQHRRDKKMKAIKKEKENMKDVSKKQRMGKVCGLQKQKKLSKKLSSTLSQNKADMWDVPNGPWVNIAETKENEYSPEVVELLSHAKSNGIHSPHTIGVFPEELLVRLYKVSEVKQNTNCLEATDLIVPGRAVIEFKGKVMLRQHYQPCAVSNQEQPYVLFYSKFEGLDLCIDATAFGGDARFIRRSCTPNAEMCHIIDNGKLHFIVQAKKEILKGTEITIPFDFDYQNSFVECACGRNNCPVAKFWKRKLAQKSPEKTKRKRCASEEGRVRRNSQSKSSPLKAPGKVQAKASPLKASPGGASPDQPVEDTDSQDGFHNIDILQHTSVVKPAPVSRRSSRLGSDTREDRESKPARQAETHHTDEMAAHAASNHHEPVHDALTSPSDAAPPSSEVDGDSGGECPRKLTREERKMEAIMKAFEKMARREERRKEALARLDKKHDVKKEEITTDNCASTPVESTVEKTIEHSAPHAVASSTVTSTSTVVGSIPEVEGKVAIKMEDSSPVTNLESPQKAQRKRSKRQRRRSRVQSCSAAENLHVTHSTAPAAFPGGMDPCPVAEDVKEEPGELVQSLPATPVTGIPESAPSAPSSTAASFIFHKTKKHLYSEWSVSRTPDGRIGGRMDPLEVQVVDEEMFVSYTPTPSPRNAMEHLQRRNSTSAGCYGRGPDSSIGNAKKRWLRQAMHETGPPCVDSGSLSPVHGDSSSPTLFGLSVPSPGGSPPGDFLTPLKKRRLARESLSQDQPPCVPFTPTPSATWQEPTDFVALQGSPVNCSAQVLATPATPPTVLLQDIAHIRTRNGLVNARSGAREEKSLENGTVGAPGQPDIHRSCPSSGSSLSETETSTGVGRDLPSSQEELSVDGLRPFCAEAASAQGLGSSMQAEGSDFSKACDMSANASECQSAESSSFSETSSMNEMMCMEVSAVDSSAEVSEEGSENVAVGCSDNEASLLNISMDSSAAGRRWPEQERVVECSSASEVDERLHESEVDISEGTVQEGEAVDDDIGDNEATSKVCDTGHSGARLPVLCPQPAATECLVNSSQDVAWTHSVVARTSPVSCSPSQGEAECYNSSDSVRENFSQSAIAGGERGRVSSAQDSSVPDFSCVTVADPEGLASSDTEYGPSSSTQVVGRARMITGPRWRREQGTDDMVCNSSDASASSIPSRHADDSNVDSTTQNGLHVTHTEAGPQAGCSEEGRVVASPSFGENDVGIFCDSNSDRGSFSVVVDEAAGIMSGPADSQSSEVLHRDQVPLINVADSSLVGTVPHISSEPGDEEQDNDRTSESRQVSSATVSQPSAAGVSDQQSVLATPSASSLDMYNLSPSLDSYSQDQLVSVSSCSMPASMEGSQDAAVSSQQLADSSRLGGELELEAGTSFHNTGLQQEGGDIQMPESSMAPGSATSDDPEALVSRVHSQGITSMFFGDDSFTSSCSSQSSTSMSVSSSEALPALCTTPAMKKKVSLLEYRKRLKDKTGPTCNSNNNSKSPKSSPCLSNLLAHRSHQDNPVTLTPLPLFEPVSVTREAREKDKEKSEKHMSLSDRLRLEFGLEDSEEEDRTNISDMAAHCSWDVPPPPPCPPNGMPRGALPGLAMRGAAEEEKDSGQAVATGYPATSPPVNVALAFPATGTSQLSLGNTVPHSHSPLPVSLAWPGKLADLQHGSLGVGLSGPAPTAPHQHRPSSSAFGSSVSQHSSVAHFQGHVGVAHLPNGSHTQPAPSPFQQSGLAGLASTFSLTKSHQSYPLAGKQQPPPPPPPPPPPLPTTAYSSVPAQSRALPPPPHLHPTQMSTQPPGRHGRSSSFSVLGATTSSTHGNGVRARHSSGDHASGRLHSHHHHLDQIGQASKHHQGHHGNHSSSDRKRH